MAIDTTREISEDMRSCIIRIKGYDNKNMEGTFYNPYYGEEVPFENLARLLLLLEDLMDDMKFPQASVQSRSFGAAPKPHERDTISSTAPAADTDALATFKVRILFRQGATWQGKVLWVEEDVETAFHSELELVKLMDSALPQE